MENKVIGNHSEKRTKFIVSWIKKIKESKINVVEYFQKHNVPFSRSQYYLYDKRIQEEGDIGVEDRRVVGGNRKLDYESEAFISGCVRSNPGISLGWIKKEVTKRFGYVLSESGVTRALQRLQCDWIERGRGRPKVLKPELQHNPCGGFELIIALAYHLGWVDMTSGAIKNAVRLLKRTKTFQESDKYCDRKGRDKLGRFTVRYTNRKEVRVNRFKSISEKRVRKNWKSMGIINEEIRTVENKSLAVLSLPVVTMNGSIRSVDTAFGGALKHIAGYDYKQNSLTKYLRDLKYLGISAQLLQNMITFWKKCWSSEMSKISQERLLCYYIDGNTKAIWSTKHVNQNKVTMLGRVMGCLEQVFIHDCFGHPIYFETHPGHAPCGEHVLGLFEKIKGAIDEIPGTRRRVCRAIVMDGASNSVRTLRAFAAQQEYHYITILDDNQWDERKVYSEGSVSRYTHGKATLREVGIELEDSQDKGYLIRTRGIKIDWDAGKMTVLITSLPVELVGASEVVRSYFNRWPAEELQYKWMKAVAVTRNNKTDVIFIDKKYNLAVVN